MRENYRNGMLGLIVGDALGVPVEFKNRQMLKVNPVTGMREYGSHMQPMGTWSDDSSMALATLVSLNKGYDIYDIAEQFSRWDKEEVYTPFGTIFDIGYTCNRAIAKFQETGDPHTCGMMGEHDNGNGSLMRILPACIYAYEKEVAGEMTEDEAIKMVHEVSALTHGHLRSLIACGLYYFYVKAILDNREELSLADCLQLGFNRGFAYYKRDISNLTEVMYFSRLFSMSEFKDAHEDTIKGSGYVLECLEASIWCLLNTKSYKEAVLKAVNLGDDTDTTAAVTGGLAGLYYGIQEVPQSWIRCIARLQWILEVCDNESINATIEIFQSFGRNYEIF